MEKFRYLVLNSLGKQIEFEVDAKDVNDAKRQIRRNGMTPVKSLGSSDTDRSFFKRGKNFSLYAFTSRLAPLLDANIPLEKALAIIEDGVQNQSERDIVLFLRKGLHEGKSFSALTRERPKLFSSLYSSLLESGEQSGNLNRVVRELRRFLKDSKEFKDFVITSSIYPVIVFSVTLLVIFLLFVVFVPKFSKVFEELGREIPAITNTMLQIGNFMRDSWFVWIFLLIGIVLFFIYGKRIQSVRIFLDKMILKIPFLGVLVISIQISRFIRTLSIMVQSNVHILSSIQISRKVIENTAISASFSGIEEKLRAGSALSDIIGTNKYMPQGSSAMLRIAEESGEMGEMLERIAAEAEENTRIKLKRLLAFFEPMIILILAGIVLLVVMAIFLAIMEMNVIR